jgi:fatty acid desaturase
MSNGSSPVAQRWPSGDYARLRRQIRAEGLLEPQTPYYLTKLATLVVLFAVSVAFALLVSHIMLIVASGLLLAFASTQAGLLSHDIIHRQAFRGRRLNTVLRLAVGNTLLGLSHSWWAQKHNAHHANPNHIDKDPDMDIPFVVFAAEQIAGRPRWTHPLIAVQTVVLPLLFLMQALSMRAMSVRHVVVEAAPARVLQLTLLAGHLALYALLLFAIRDWLSIVLFVVTHQLVFGLYNSAVFASNHKGMPTMRDGERLDFLREQVLTSRDVDGHPFTDFLYGGLNYQVEHHLFPTMPRNNFAKAQPIVRQFCADHNIPYHSDRLFGAYRDAWTHLHRASSELRGSPKPSTE